MFGSCPKCKDIQVDNADAQTYLFDIVKDSFGPSSSDRLGSRKAYSKENRIIDTLYLFSDGTSSIVTEKKSRHVAMATNNSPILVPT